MAYTLRIKRAWYDELNWQCQDQGVRRLFAAGLFMQESSWNAIAKGDYVNGNPTSFGIGQIQAGAARDAGWTGTETSELYVPLINIKYSVRYLAKCAGWARIYDKRGDVDRWGIDACAASVYNQGPGGFSNRGIAGNHDSYVKPVLKWVEEITAGGLVADDTGEVVVPPTGNPGDPPLPPEHTPPDLEELMSKYAESMRKALALESAARPWPPAEDFHTDVGKVLYFLATSLRDVVSMVQEWLGRIPS